MSPLSQPGKPPNAVPAIRTAFTRADLTAIPTGRLIRFLRVPSVGTLQSAIGILWVDSIWVSFMFLVRFSGDFLPPADFALNLLRDGFYAIKSRLVPARAEMMPLRRTEMVFDPVRI